MEHGCKVTMKGVEASFGGLMWGIWVPTYPPASRAQESGNSQHDPDGDRSGLLTTHAAQVRSLQRSLQGSIAQADMKPQYFRSSNKSTFNIEPLQLQNSCDV